MTKEQIEQVIQDTFTQFKGSDRGARVLACRQIFETYYTPLEASHRDLVEVLEGIKDALSTIGVSVPPTTQSVLSNAKKLINE